MLNAIHNSPRLEAVLNSKWTDTGLILGGTAFLIAGILGSSGVFNFVGATNAAAFSYGMYGGAGLFAIAEIGKQAINYYMRSRNFNNNRVNFNFDTDYNTQIISITYCNSSYDYNFGNPQDVTITFNDGERISTRLPDRALPLLIQGIDQNKIIRSSMFREYANSITNEYSLPNYVHYVDFNMICSFSHEHFQANVTQRSIMECILRRISY